MNQIVIRVSEWKMLREEFRWVAEIEIRDRKDKLLYEIRPAPGYRTPELALRAIVDTIQLGIVEEAWNKALDPPRGT